MSQSNKISLCQNWTKEVSFNSLQNLTVASNFHYKTTSLFWQFKYHIPKLGCFSVKSKNPSTKDLKQSTTSCLHDMSSTLQKRICLVVHLPTWQKACCLAWEQLQNKLKASLDQKLKLNEKRAIYVTVVVSEKTEWEVHYHCE